MRCFGAFKTRIRPFNEEVYGANRFFDVINDEVFGNKVIMHKTLFDAISDERLHGVHFTCPESDLLVGFNHVSVYEYNRTKYLLIGP